MSELCLSSSSSKATTQSISSLLLTRLMLFFSFIRSHLLYFSYLIFFSPYLLKLLSFLSPLFITTSLLLLLLLCFLTLSPSYDAVLQRLRPKPGDEDDVFDQFEDLEAYKIVFDTSEPFYAGQKAEDARGESGSELEEKTLEIAWEETTRDFSDENKVDFGKIAYNVKEKVVELPGIKSHKVGLHKGVSPVRGGSEALWDKQRGGGTGTGTGTVNGGVLYISKGAANSRIPDKTVDDGIENNSGEYTSRHQTIDDTRLIGSYDGSRRKEKEWKRTLACKLFEERQNADGGEDMDLLWETYETGSSDKAANKPRGNTKKKADFGCYDDNEEEEDIDRELCCLQALKLSTGKMKLGVGRPNLVKISKAFKGIGWLHRLNKHGGKNCTIGRV